MLACMVFQTIYPAIANPVTELLFLSVQNVLQTGNTNRNKKKVEKICMQNKIIQIIKLRPSEDTAVAHRQRHCGEPIFRSGQYHV